MAARESAALGTIVFVALLGAGGCDQQHPPRGTFDKQRQASVLERFADRSPENRTVFVKFVEGSKVRLEGGELVALAAGHRSALAAFNALVDGLGVERIERTFAHRSVEALDQERARLRAKGHDLADLNLHYRLTLAPGHDPIGVSRELNAQPVVEIAWVKLKQRRGLR